MINKSQIIKAVFLTGYGTPDVLEVKEVQKPVPGENEVLIRVYAASVNYGDTLARNFRSVTPKQFNMLLLFWLFARIFFGWKKPKVTILGSEFAGEIESVGQKVTQYKTGDRVFGYLGQNMGAYSEYICLPEKGVITHKPQDLTYEQAAAASYGSVMALYLIKKAGVKDGQNVLIVGASGAIGSAAVQIAKHMGAKVTGICSTDAMDYVHALGADKVIDYKKEDFTQNGLQYDLVFDILGKSSFSQCKQSLKTGGVYFRVSFKTRELLQMLKTAIAGDKRVVCALAPGSREDLIRAKALMDAGKIRVIIDQAFPFEEAAKAHRYYESGKKKGSIVLTFK